VDHPSPWPPPHPVIDAPYGPRYQAPAPPPVPEPQGRRAGWDLTPIEPTPRTRRWAAIFVALCMIAAIGGGVLAYRFVTDTRFPSRWDSRVADLAVFVERSTSLRFSHPVQVRFLYDAEFNKLVSTEETELSDDDRKKLTDEAAIGRAFGWFSGATDLLEERNQLQTSGVLALYSFDRREVVVRTSDPGAVTLSPALRATIVHELVHVIQDQRLSIRKLQANAEGDAEQQAFLALLEGHAVHVERQYLETLSPEELAAFDRETEGLIDEVEAETEDVPRVLTAALEAPYVVGPALVAAAEASRAGIEQLYVRPPVALDQVADPRAYFTDDTPEDLPEPSVPGTALEADSAGIVGLYLTLAAALTPERAWEAALGWGNDIFVPYRADADAALCVRWDIVADNEQAAATLRTAIGEWAATRVGSAKVSVDGTTPSISVTMCDPGTEVKQDLIAQDAVDSLYLRISLLTQIIPETPSLDSAYCATDAILDDIPAAQLRDPDDSVRMRVRDIIERCTSSATPSGGS